MSEESVDDSIATTIIGVGTTLQITTFALVVARITSRTSSGKALRPHDWAVLLAEILSFPQLIFIFTAISYGYGRHQRFVPFENVVTAMRYVFVSQVLFYWSATLVKISVALLLLSLKHERAWRNFLYTTMAILGSSFVMIQLLQFFACLPVSSYWDPRVRVAATCWPLQAISGVVVAFSVINALADIIYSLMPLTFLIHLRQPLFQRVVITGLMGLGLFASITVVFRTVGGLSLGGDRFRTDADTSLLALVELHLGVIAATLPTLKVVFQDFLLKLKNSIDEGPTEEETRSLLCRMGLLDDIYSTMHVKSEVLE